MHNISELKYYYPGNYLMNLSDKERLLLVDVRNSLQCSLCKKTMHDPMLLPCGHNFCWLCLNIAFSKKSECPDCRGFYRPVDMMPSRFLDDIISSFLRIEHMAGAAGSTQCAQSSPQNSPPSHSNVCREGSTNDNGDVTAVPDTFAETDHSFPVYLSQNSHTRTVVVGTDVIHDTFQEEEASDLAIIGGVNTELDRTGSNALEDEGNVTETSTTRAVCDEHAQQIGECSVTDKITETGTETGTEIETDVSDQGTLVDSESMELESSFERGECETNVTSATAVPAEAVGADAAADDDVANVTEDYIPVADATDLNLPSGINNHENSVSVLHNENRLNGEEEDEGKLQQYVEDAEFESNDGDDTDQCTYINSMGVHRGEEEEQEEEEEEEKEEERKVVGAKLGDVEVEDEVEVDEDEEDEDWVEMYCSQRTPITPLGKSSHQRRPEDCLNGVDSFGRVNTEDCTRCEGVSGGHCSHSSSSCGSDYGLMRVDRNLHREEPEDSATKVDDCVLSSERTEADRPKSTLSPRVVARVTTTTSSLTTTTSLISLCKHAENQSSSYLESSAFSQGDVYEYGTSEPTDSCVDLIDQMYAVIPEIEQRLKAARRF